MPLSPSIMKLQNTKEKEKSSNLSKQKQVTVRERKLPKQRISKNAAQGVRRLWGTLRALSLG